MKVKKLVKDEEGSVLPLVTIILGLFALGFVALVIDVGTLYVERKAMITAADAAALAGAQVLKESQGADTLGAEEAVMKYAKANGVDESKLNPNPVVSESVKLSNGHTETRQVVKVTVVKNKPLIFARFLGNENTDADVKAHAIATWGYVTKSSYFPLFVFDSAYDAYSDLDDEDKKNTYITLHDNVSVSGSKTNSFGFVEVNNNPSMNEIKQAIEGTLDVEPKSKGDLLGGVPGKRESVYDSAVKRIGDIVLIPVISSADFITNDVNNGNANQWELLVSYFACFKITNVTKENVSVTKQDGNGKQTQDSVQIVGQFTGKTADSNIIVEDGDQTNPKEGEEPPATYSKLIQ